MKGSIGNFYKLFKIKNKNPIKRESKLIKSFHRNYFFDELSKFTRNFFGK